MVFNNTSLQHYLETRPPSSTYTPFLYQQLPSNTLLALRDHAQNQHQIGREFLRRIMVLGRPGTRDTLRHQLQVVINDWYDINGTCLVEIQQRAVT